MTRDFAPDPEVEADRRRRESAPDAAPIDDMAPDDPRSVRLAALYGWKPPAIVENWACRGCGEPVGMPQEAVDAAKTINRKLIAAGDKPFTRRELACCDPCRAKERVAERAKERADSESISALMREVRRGVHPWRRTAIADELRGLGITNSEQLIRENETMQAPSGARSKSL